MDKNNDDKVMDLSHALDNSGNHIKFGDEKFQRPARSFQTPTPKIVKYIIKSSSGLIKDEKQANYFLIGFVVVIIIVSLFLFFGGDSSSYNEKTIPPMPAAEWNPNFRP